MIKFWNRKIKRKSYVGCLIYVFWSFEVLVLFLGEKLKRERKRKKRQKEAKKDKKNKKFSIFFLWPAFLLFILHSIGSCISCFVKACSLCRKFHIFGRPPAKNLLRRVASKGKLRMDVLVQFVTCSFLR